MCIELISGERVNFVFSDVNQSSSFSDIPSIAYYFADLELDISVLLLHDLFFFF